jgi:spermidine synthase
MEYVEVARAVGERGEVVLRERRETAEAGTPGVLELRVNGVFVADGRETTTEQALAQTALANVEKPRVVVVAGLGLGFTAHEVLADPRVEQLVVVEVEDALVGWMRDGTIPHGPGYLADERVSVVMADIRLAMAEATASTYDLVLLDVDNGPGYLVYEDNAEVYQRAFLEQVRAALRPGGAVAIWSAAESAELRGVLEDVFGNAMPIPYDVELQGRQETYWLYLAHRRSGSALGTGDSR